MRPLRLTLAVFIAGAWLPAGAQQAPPLKPFKLDDDRPVMRAQPVAPPATIPDAPAATPIPVRRADPATPVPVRRADPATPRPEATPRATPAPREAPVRAPAAPKATPAPKAAPAAAPEVPDPGGEIRIAPGVAMTQEQVQLSIADGLYARKDFAAAAPEYERYLGLYPNGTDRATALFRLGESYRQTGAVNAAKTSYEQVVSQFPTSDFAGPAAYRLGDLYFQERNFNAAIPQYRRASTRLKDPKLVTSAKFFTARSLEAVGQKVEARALYEELANSPSEDRTFHDASRLSYALLLKDAGRSGEALKQMQTLARETTQDEVKAQATVYSGLWKLDGDGARRTAEERKKILKSAEDDLRKALAMPAGEKWKELAQLGLIQVLFTEEKYQQVIEIGAKNSAEFSPEARGQVLNLVAKAHRALGQHREAIPVLEQIIKEAPDTPAAKEAAYERIGSLYMSNDEKLIAEIDEYLVNNPDAQKRDQVQLMKAEVLFKKQDYAGAAPIYELLDNSRTLPGTLKGEALFKRAWCRMETREFDAAIKALTALIEEHPTSKWRASAHAQRGLAKLRLKDLTGAVKDFDILIQRYPKAKERELALFQKAMILGQQGDNRGMAETFKLLLAEFPKTPEADEANYWIGWEAFESKDYSEAIAPLEKARTLNSEEFFERASLRIMLSAYYTEDRDRTAKEVDAYLKSGKAQPPVEVLRWLAEEYRKTAAHDAAAKYFELLLSRDEATPEDHHKLAGARLEAKQFAKAAEAFERYLTLVKEPVPRATGFLGLARAQLGARHLDAAQKSVDEVVKLQPVGKLNAEAREVAGDISATKGSYEDAAKIFESVAVIVRDDEEMAPRALEKAIFAVRRTGKEPEAKRLLNLLQSRYPEYYQRYKDRIEGTDPAPAVASSAAARSSD